MSAPPANRLAITLAQLNPIVGDVSGNAEKVRAARKARGARTAPISIIFPEMFIAGYPPEDLVLKPASRRRAARESKAWRARRPTAARR
jgi:NAD+ synthase